jgi:serine/threonine-protein kinase
MSQQYEELRAILVDRYLIQREVGRGGGATVYLAEDRKHRRRVAVKVLRPEVSHAVGPEQETLRIAHQVAGALAHAHRHNIVHRDIKPENVLLSEGNALVTDFGIGKAVCDVCEDDHITVAGTTIGTPAYMSPEQSLGEEVDARSDVYSLACLLYEMLTGRPPFQGSTAQATLVLHAVQEIPSARDHVPELPQYLDEALQRAMAKSPDDRYDTITDFVQALGLVSTAAVPAAVASRCENCGAEVLPGRSVCAHCGTQLIVRPRAGARGRSRRWIATAVTAFGVVLGVLGMWWVLGSPVLGAQQIESLAILPLVNLSGDSAQGHFVDGMHDALIAEVAQVGALKVISRTSVMRYRGSEESVSDIAEALGVDAILEGSVVRSGDSVRITAQLIAAAPERHLWTGSYDRELRDVFSIYNEVAR